MVQRILKWDGHTHAQFCKHGSPAPLMRYVEQAIAQQFARYTISEHAPLPARWVADASLMQELAMSEAELSDYVADACCVKKAVQQQLDVCVGLEVDYLYGSESFTHDLICGALSAPLDDVIMSVHYLPACGGMRCIDYTPAYFQEHIIGAYGTMEKVVDAYYDQVEWAIVSTASWANQVHRVRLGHVLLIEKFRAVLPVIDPAQTQVRLQRLIPLLQTYRVGIDVNMAGLRKPHCRQMYVPLSFMRQCVAHDIPLVYGSDAHDPTEVGSGWGDFVEAMTGIASP